MKRVLSVLMAGALTVAMAVPAFAASAVVDEDGVAHTDGSSVTFNGTSISGDPARPNGTYFIPMDQLAHSKTLSGAIASYYSDAAASKASTTIEDVNYSAADTAVPYSEKLEYSVASLADTDLFKFNVDKDDGSKFIKKISVVEDKVLGSLARTTYLKIELNDSTTTSELKATGTISFKAKATSASLKASKKLTRAGEFWDAGETISIPYSLWINNTKVTGTDGSTGTGDRVYFDPTKNETNTLVWGDDRAAVYFEANDDASKFYARLQTKADSEIYSTYGDPVNADLWFYDFVGNPTVPSTSRATLTLGIPWDEDDDYTPKPEDCFIYEKDADGNLVDVTSKFTYDADNDSTTGIEGWTIKTRTLGTYVISDTELDTTVTDDVDEEPADDTSSAVVDGGKEIPNTGSSDMVGVAVVAAVVSLAAAGAVAFKKASK